MPTVSQAAIGNWFSSAGTWLNGYFQSIAIYNNRIPDAVLRKKTTVGAAY
jgi:hypothetical protein